LAKLDNQAVMHHSVNRRHSGGGIPEDLIAATQRPAAAILSSIVRANFLITVSGQGRERS